MPTQSPINYNKDYYAVLMVPKDATRDDIKKAYRTWAKRCHPDVLRNANLSEQSKKNLEEKFKEVSEAYGVLSDPVKRADYNLTSAYVNDASRESYAGQSESDGSQAPRTYYWYWDPKDTYHEDPAYKAKQERKALFARIVKIAVSLICIAIMVAISVVLITIPAGQDISEAAIDTSIVVCSVVFAIVLLFVPVWLLDSDS